MTEDDKALVERLRSQGHLTQGDGLLALLDTGNQAADQIEADGKRIAELIRLLRDCDPESMSWLDARDDALDAFDRAALGDKG